MPSLNSSNSMQEKSIGKLMGLTITFLFAIYGFCAFIFTTERIDESRFCMDYTVGDGVATTSVHCINGKLIVVEKQYISLLTEKKECEEKGGEFKIDQDWEMRQDGNLYSTGYTLTCTSPSKVISEVRI